MHFKIGLENGVEGRSLAWALDHPGCFAYGRDEHEALHHLPAAIQDYIDWLTLHNHKSWLRRTEVRLEANETWEVYTINENYELAERGYEVNAWFLHDWKPLTKLDIDHALKLLAWSRADLLESVRGLSQEALDVEHPGERWNITNILKHVGGAEWWYLDRLGLAFPRDEVPNEPFRRLEKVRTHLVNTLPGLVGSHQVVGVDGELWSPRKLLRRAVWHERDHTFHIRKLL